MTKAATPLRLVFYAVDDYCKLKPLPVKKDNVHHHWLDKKAVPEFLFNWDASVRAIQKALISEKWGLSKEVEITDYDTINPFADNQIIVLFAWGTYLGQKSFYKNMFKKLRYINQTGVIRSKKHNDHWKEQFPCPVITVSEDDFMALYEEIPIADYMPSDLRIHWKNKRWHPEQNLRVYRQGADHRVKFLDSSIWHRFVHDDKPAHIKSGKASFVNRFGQTLKEIVSYHHLGLYQARTALSTLEFQCRMFLNSYIQRIGDLDHFEAVRPFKFHSETFAREQTELILKFFEKTGNDNTCLAQQLRWDMLMVDDFAHRALSSVQKTPLNNEASVDEKAPEKTPTLTKKELIEYWVAGKIPESMQENTSLLKRNGLNAFVKEHSRTPENGKGYISQAIDILGCKSTPKMYDVVLLDYLLGEAEPPEDDAAKRYFPKNLREYGHEFLLELDERIFRNDGRFPRGPLGRYWIFPISTFPYAFPDKLRQMSLDGINENWYLSNGGDPVCNPEQFRMNFFLFLLQQVGRCYMHPEAMARWVDRFSGIEDPQEWCKALKLNLEVEKNKLKLLNSIREFNSAFCESIFNYLQEVRYEAILKHLLNLVDKINLYGPKEYNAALMHQFSLADTPLHDSDYKSVLSIFKNQIHKFASNPLIEFAKHRLKGNLKSIKDFTNHKVYFIPDEIPAMNWFEEINLKDHGISDLREQFGNQPRLKRLDLSGNALCAVPKVLLQFTGEKIYLNYLNLSGNPFTKYPEASDLNWIAETRDDVEELIKNARKAGLIEE